MSAPGQKKGGLMRTIALLFAIVAVALPAMAETGGVKTETDVLTIPHVVSYQGRLLNSQGHPVTDSTYSVQFRLYTVGSGGSPFWTETQSVHTTTGLFTVLLGSVTPLSSFPEAGSCYLGMQVGADPEMTPRVRIASAAYCYLAQHADTANYAPSGGGYWTLETGQKYIYPSFPGGGNDHIRVWKLGQRFGISDTTIADTSSAIAGANAFHNVSGILGAGANADSGPCGVYGCSYREDLPAGLYFNQLAGVSTRLGWYDHSLYRRYGLSTTGDVLVGGNFWVTGSKSAVVGTRDYGRRAVYCVESPEVWFEDFGSSKLVNGRAHIELDPVFRQTVAINAQNPMKVFVTPTDGSAIALGTTKGLTGFDVVGPDGSNASFDWRAVAKRAGYETHRLDPENGAGR
jgi:hypothetical protein